MSNIKEEDEFDQVSDGTHHSERHSLMLTGRERQPSANMMNEIYKAEVRKI